jgi:transcription elongation factor Elf1
MGLWLLQGDEGMTPEQRRIRAAELMPDSWDFRCPRCGCTLFSTPNQHAPSEKWRAACKNCRSQYERDVSCSGFDPDNDLNDSWALGQHLGMRLHLSNKGSDEYCWGYADDEVAQDTSPARALTTAILAAQQQKDSP